jgi:tRNA (guanine10-N2)-dimethyltransferase
MIVYGDPSGGRIDIAEAELGALFESAGQNVKTTSLGGVVTCEADSLPSWAASRGAFLKDVGELLWQGEAEELEGAAASLDGSRLAGRRFKVDTEGFGASEKKELDELYGERVLSSAKASTVSLKEPDSVLRVVRNGDCAFVGLTTPRGRGKWVSRRPRARAFFHPSALFPKLARLMVNLTAVRPGGTFLDPFSGTCSTVIEAALVGAYSIGLDIDKRMVFGGRRNLRGFGLDEASQVFRGDVRFLPFREVDAIAGDVPYGRASSTQGSASVDLLSSMLSEGGKCLRNGGRLVVMHQKGSALAQPKGFELLGEYEFYVHRSLTRVISVLRKR